MALVKRIFDRRAAVQSVTSVAPSPAADMRSRMIRYSIAMAVRVLCLVVGLAIGGWQSWIFFAGAIFLPYFAVIIANDVRVAGQSSVSTPVLPLASTARQDKEDAS